MRTNQLDTGYYAISKISGMGVVRQIFPDGKANELNWLLLSTSGVHGHYGTLDELAEYFADPKAWEERENGGEPYAPTITVLVVKPRIVQILYGTIDVTAEDIPFLRGLVESSLEGITKSQIGNRP